MPRITLEDVARKAGVSTKTVSRVINNEPNVADETCAKVKQAIAELNFVPNLAARNLSTGKAMAIGLTVGWPTYSTFSSALVDYTLRASAQNNYGLALFSLEGDATKRIINAFMGKQIDGIILDTNAAETRGLVAKLDAINMPYVIIHPNTAKGYKNASTIRIDERLAARQASQFLIQLGHKAIGYVSNDLKLTQESERLTGLRSALADANLSFNEGWISKSNGNEIQVGFSGVTQILTRHPEVSAIFAETDEIAIGVLSGILQMGLKVPDDISVIGFDDIPTAEMIMPPLTTVHQPIDEIARTAVRQLITAIKDPQAEPVDIVMPTRLVIRDTCKPVSIERLSVYGS